MKITKQQLINELPERQKSFMREIEKACASYDEETKAGNRIKAVKFKSNYWSRLDE